MLSYFSQPHNSLENWNLINNLKIPSSFKTWIHDHKSIELLLKIFLVYDIRYWWFLTTDFHLAQPKKEIWFQASHIVALLSTIYQPFDQSIYLYWKIMELNNKEIHRKLTKNHHSLTWLWPRNQSLQALELVWN